MKPWKWRVLAGIAIITLILLYGYFSGVFDDVGNSSKPTPTPAQTNGF